MLINADIVTWANAYDGPLFHACLCDAPYHLTDVHTGGVDIPGKFGERTEEQKAARSLARKGFMGRNWDGVNEDGIGVAFDPNTWHAIARVLHPGAFGMSFAGARGWHRMATAIEQAGLIIHPTMFCWGYGSGFPKATRVPDVRFNGHRYGLQTLKPACEPIVIFSKPQVCYNEVQRLCADISLMLEDLWTRFADTVENITMAEPIVRSVLHNAETFIAKHEAPTFASDVARNSSGDNRRSKRAAERIAQKHVKMQKLDSGTIAPIAESTSTSGRQLLPVMPSSTCTVADPATPNIETNSAHGYADSAAHHSSPPDPGATNGTAQTNAVTHPEKSQRLTTPSETATVIDTRAAILQYNSEKAVCDLSTIWLWSIIWGDLLDLVSKYTTGTELKITTTLQTLNSSLLRLTLASRDIASEKNSSDRLWLYAASVNAHFSGLWTSLKELRPFAPTAKLEPIIMFQKPYAGRPVDSITATGAGALWIDGGRISTNDKLGGGNLTESVDQASDGWDRPWRHDPDYVAGFAERAQERVKHAESLGRWPSNLNLCHHPLCEPRGTRTVKGRAGAADYTPTGDRGLVSVAPDYKTGAHYGDEEITDWACHPDCAVAVLGRQSGESADTPHKRQPNVGNGYHGNMGARPDYISGIGDTGTAARFFFNADYILERLETADLLFYCAKASRSEREAGLDPRQIVLFREWAEVDEIKQQDTDHITYGDSQGIPGTKHTPNQHNGNGRRNTHATVKPLSLNRQLATLLLPPAAYAPRRILIPFGGVGSECIGALLAGWEEVVGVELEQEHVNIGNARIAYWQQRRWELQHPDTKITATTAPTMDGQLDMFYEEDA